MSSREGPIDFAKQIALTKIDSHPATQSFSRETKATRSPVPIPQTNEYPSLPTGYDVSKHVSTGRRDCLLTVGFDRRRRRIPRFLIQLYYRISTDPIEWTWIARMDHNETSALGHDVYHEGLHVDVDRQSKRTVHLKLAHSPYHRVEEMSSAAVSTTSNARPRTLLTSTRSVGHQNGHRRGRTVVNHHPGLSLRNG